MDEFEKLVKEMRAMQKQYFKTRDALVLQKAKSLEWQVDAILKRKEDSESQQMDLFGGVKNANVQ